MRLATAKANQMIYTWKATVILEEKYMQDVTVQAPDVLRARAIIERQYGRIISGPQQVFEPIRTTDTSFTFRDFILGALGIFIVLILIGVCYLLVQIGAPPKWVYGTLAVIIICLVLAGQQSKH